MTCNSYQQHKAPTGFVLSCSHVSAFTGDSLSYNRNGCSYTRTVTEKLSRRQPYVLPSAPTARLSNSRASKQRFQSPQQPKTQPQRLQKVLAQMGFASRRGAEKMIEEGQVRVNNKRITQQGILVVPGKDTIHVDGKIATIQKPVWIAVHKPRGMNSLPSRIKRSVDSNVPSGRRKGLLPVASLEENASGLLILSNDRAAVAKLNSPDDNLVKEWIVDCYGPFLKSKVIALQRGVRLEGENEMFIPKTLQCLGSEYIELSPREKAVLTRFVVRVRKHRSQLMSRLFSAVGLEVARMSRRAFGPILLSPLKRGEFRYLTPNEIKALMRGVKGETVTKDRRRHRRIS